MPTEAAPDGTANDESLKRATLRAEVKITDKQVRLVNGKDPTLGCHRKVEQNRISRRRSGRFKPL